MACRAMQSIDKLIKIAGYLSAFVLIVLMVLIVYDATARYIFSGGSIALQELEWHLFDIVILFGIAYALRSDAHVRVDIFYAHFAPKTKAIINLISALFFILPFSLLLIYLGIDFVLLSYAQHEASSNPGGLEYRFLVKSLLPLSFVFLLLQSVVLVEKEYRLWRDA